MGEVIGKEEKKGKKAIQKVLPSFFLMILDWRGLILKELRINVVG